MNYRKVSSIPIPYDLRISIIIWYQVPYDTKYSYQIELYIKYSDNLQTYLFNP